MHIQIYCVCLIRYFRQVISLINTMKFWSIVIIIFSFQNWLTDEVLLKCVTCYNYPFTCSNCSSFCSNYSSSMLAFHPRIFDRSISIFYKELITFVTSFISLFYSVSLISKPEMFESPGLFGNIVAYFILILDTFCTSLDILARTKNIFFLSFNFFFSRDS